MNIFNVDFPNWTKEDILGKVTLLACIEDNVDKKTDVYRKYIADIAIVPVVRLGDEEEGLFARITRKGLEEFSISETEIFTAASENANNDEIDIFCVDEQLKEVGILEEDAEVVPLFVVTNGKRSLGAHFITNEKVLSTLYSELGKFYMFPSRIHEIMIVPEKFLECDSSSLVEMVRGINKDVVDENILLSNQVFYYDGDKLQVVEEEE